MAEEARRLLSGCVRTLLGRYFVPGWELRRPCLGIASSLVGKLVVPAWEMARPWLGIFCTCLGIRGLRLGILLCPPGAGESYRGKSDLVTLVTFESYRGK